MLYLVGLEHSQCSAIKLMCACKILGQSHELFCVELTLSYLQALHSNKSIMYKFLIIIPPQIGLHRQL